MSSLNLATLREEIDQIAKKIDDKTPTSELINLYLRLVEMNKSLRLAKYARRSRLSKIEVKMLNRQNRGLRSGENADLSRLNQERDVVTEEFLEVLMLQGKVQALMNRTQQLIRH